MPVTTKRLLLVADMVHSYIYREAFPDGLGEIDLVLGAGDLRGDYLEFIATKVTCPVVYVHGNHDEEFIRDSENPSAPKQAPGGVINAHGRRVRVAGLNIVGWGGAPRYRADGHGQYQEWQARLGLLRLRPGLLAAKTRGQGVDVFLTHAPPPGPHAGQDFAHRGSPALQEFTNRYRPGLHVHGHVHAYEGKKIEYTDGTGLRVINAYGYRVVELDLEAG